MSTWALTSPVSAFSSPKPQKIALIYASRSISFESSGINGDTVIFAKALTKLAEGGMILVSPPVEKVLDGALDQLINSMKGAERLNVPRLVHMGALVFEDCEAFHNSERRKEGDEATPGSFEELMNSQDNSNQPVNVSHIYNEPLFGRHIFWDDTNLKLGATKGADGSYKIAEQRTLGYYDAPVTREGVPEYAVVVFGDVDEGHALHNLDPELFSMGVVAILATMERLLVKHNGYNVPQREGHFMMTFKNPSTAVAFHVELQATLASESMEWPKGFSENPLTFPMADPTNVSRNIYNGLTVSLGMSTGLISKALERSRANYLGPTCNRAARVSGLARNGQLLMCESEFLGIRHQIPNYKQGEGKDSGLQGEVRLKNQVLKGIKGTHNIIYLETDELTKTRAISPRIVQKLSRASMSALASSRMVSNFANTPNKDALAAVPANNGDGVQEKTDL